MFVGRWVQRARYGVRKKWLNKQLGISLRYSTIWKVVFCLSISAHGKASLFIDWPNLDSSWRDCWSIHLGSLWSPHPAPVFPLWGNGEPLPYICVSHSVGKFVFLTLSNMAMFLRWYSSLPPPLSFSLSLSLYLPTFSLSPPFSSPLFQSSTIEGGDKSQASVSLFINYPFFSLSASWSSLSSPFR